MKNQKIGLVTTHYAVNYGAVLQAYALFKTIKKINGKCEIIDYTPKNKSIGRRIIYQFDSIKSIVYSFIKFINITYKKNQIKKVAKFDTFLEKNFDFTNSKFISRADLKKNLEEYDILICGSDQIWNLNLFNDETMFLKFGDKLKAKKNISYAPSIAAKMTNNQLKIIAKNIEHFSSLSLRESIGIDELVSFTNKKIRHVLDPIFLLPKNEWNNICESVAIKQPYILLYIVGGTGKYIKQIVRLIRENLNYQLVYINLSPFDKFHSDLSINRASPEQFLSLIKNADFVITSSFHGTAFSAHFGKEFFCYPLKNRSSRHESLLKQLGLEERILNDDNFIAKCSKIKKIDYSKADKLKEKNINNSLDFLASSIYDE